MSETENINQPEEITQTQSETIPLQKTIDIEEKKQETVQPLVVTGKKKKEKGFRSVGIYSRCLITRSIILPITSIGKNLISTIEKYIKQNFEGKCVVEGFIKQGSTKIITTSSGILKAENVLFEVVFECDVCFPVEGMKISCVAKEITLAGIRAESAVEKPSPIVAYIARDHHYSEEYFSEIKEGDKITMRIIGQRFELNDKFISVIGELVKPKDETKYQVKKPKQKIIIEDDDE
jgi:hypothetical protein